MERPDDRERNMHTRIDTRIVGSMNWNIALPKSGCGWEIPHMLREQFPLRRRVRGEIGKSRAKNAAGKPSF